jgi:hypothetical protein
MVRAVTDRWKIAPSSSSPRKAWSCRRAWSIVRARRSGL